MNHQMMITKPIVRIQSNALSKMINIHKFISLMELPLPSKSRCSERATAAPKENYFTQ